MLLFGFGVFAIGAGILQLLGLTNINSPLTRILVGIAAIGGGIGMVRTSRGPNPRMGGQA